MMRGGDALCCASPSSCSHVEKACVDLVTSRVGTPCVVRRPRPAPSCQGDASVPTPPSSAPAPTDMPFLSPQITYQWVGAPLRLPTPLGTGQDERLLKSQNGSNNRRISYSAPSCAVRQSVASAVQ